MSAFAKKESASEDFFGLGDLEDEDQPAEDAAGQSDWKNLGKPIYSFRQS